MSNPTVATSGKIIKQLFYHEKLPCGLSANFEKERAFFWSEIIEMLTTKDVIYQAGISGSNLKQLIVKFKNVYGLRRNEQQMLITLLIELLFMRKNVRTDSKVLLFSFLNEMLATKDDFPDFKLDWKSFYEFYKQEFHNNNEKPFHNEQHNISIFSQFIDLVKRCKKYFDPSSIPEVYEMFKQNYTPAKADHSMNFLTLFLKIDTDAPKQVYEDLIADLVQYLSFLYCSRNTLTLYNIMKILRQFKSLSWEKYYDDIFTTIFRNMNNLLILDTATAEENFMNTLISEEPIRVKSIMKQIPDFLVHLLLPSTHPKYEIVWQYIERVFLLIDRVFDPNNKADQCDQLLKLFKSFVRKFIVRYDQEQHDLRNLADPTVARVGDDQDDVLDLDYNTSEYQIPEYLQEKNWNKGTGKKEFDQNFILDGPCKERFLQLMDKFLKKIIYMEDTSHSSCKTLMWLSYFDPQRFVIPIIEHVIASFDYIDNMALSTVKNIVLFIMPILCDRKLCPTGLKYIPQFLKASYKLFEVQGVKDNVDLMEAYSKMFMILPIEKYNDLKDQFKVDHPDKSAKDLQEYMVSEESSLEVDVCELIQKLELFAQKYFKLIVDNLNSMDMQESESCTLTIDFNNIFWSFIVNSSHSLRLNYLDILFNKLGENIISEAQQEIAYILDCFSLTEPEALLNKAMNLVESRLLKPRTDMSSIEKMKSNVMWHFLENNENKDRILEKEFALFSDTSIKYFVNILENAMSYSRNYIIKHLDTIETIVFLCSFQEDLTVFEKACDLIHTVILTLGYVYPTDVSYLNPSERTPDSKYKYISRIGRSDLKKFNLDWYTPSAAEKTVIYNWLNKSFYQSIKFFKDTYLSKPEQFPLLDYEKDYMLIINNMLFDDQSDNILQVSKLQKDFYKVLYVVLASFSGINVRVPFIKPAEGKVVETERQLRQKEVFSYFEKNFMFEELASMRNDLTDLCLNLPSVFHHTKTIQDASLVELYQYICKECFGESYLIDEIKKSNDMLDGLCTLNDFHRPNLYGNRFSLANECITYLNEKIDMFFYLNPFYGEQKIQLFNCFFILSFHPSYVFRMSLRYNHDPVFECRKDNPYEEMHIKAFQIMKHYIFEQQIFKKEATPVIEKVQELLLSNLRIESLQRLPCCAANPDLFKYIFSSIDVFEQLDKKIWQQKVLEQLMKTLTSTYQDSYLFQQLRKDVDWSCKLAPVIQTCAEYADLRSKIKINRESISLEDALNIKATFIEIISQANAKLENPKVHWKTKILCGLFVVYFLNVIDDLNHPEVARFARISLKFAADTSDNHVSQYGRSILFRLLNMRKRRTVQKSYEPKPGFFGPSPSAMDVEDNQEGEYTLEEFLTYHFVKKSDLSSFLIKSREIGTYYDYPPLYNKFGYEMEESEGLFAQTVREIVLSEEYFSHLVDAMFEAKEIYASEQDDTDQDQTHIDLSQSEVFDQIQILYNFTFDSDKKKVSLFNINLNFNLFEFYARLFKKIFQALGHKFFEISHKKIESLLDDFNSLPKQRVVSIYVWSILKWIQRLSREERKQYMDFCVRIASVCVVNCSLELFRDWMMSISLASKNNTYDNVEEFSSRMLEILKHEKGLGKRFRYHKLLKVVLTLNQCWARKYAIEGLHLIIDNEIEDIKQCDEHTELFADILCSGIICRINPKKVREGKWIKGGLEKYVESGQIVIQDDYSAFENNSLILTFINKIFEKLKNVKNESQKKLYSHMCFKVLESIAIKKLNDLFWSIFRQFFMYILDNKPDNVNEIEILKLMACNEYPSHIRKDIKSIMYQKIEADNWVSRQKVLLFCENFLYFESYSENSVKIDGILVKGLSDKNNAVSLLAIECLCEVVKIATREEQQQIFSTYRSQAAATLPKEKNSEAYKQMLEKKQIAVQVLMALLLAFQEEILPWTEEALREVIASKSLNPNMKKKVKEFVGKYWRDQTEVITFNSLTLSDKIKKQIREIANPYDYFA